jgi:hypothetical protein
MPELPGASHDQTRAVLEFLNNLWELGTE